MGGIHLIFCLLWACVNVCECEPVMFGEVSSPLYPQPYPADLKKQWDLEVPQGYQIQLTFNHLDIEPSPNCYYDSLMVVSDKKFLGKFCGQNSTDRYYPGNKPILAPGNRLQLVFQTDDSNHVSHLGFTAFYQAVDIDECTSFSVENESDPPCSQICLNTLGSYLCACHHGYQLRPDQRTCISCPACSETLLNTRPTMNPAVKLLRLRQGNRPLKDYVAEFCGLCHLVDFNDIALKDLFRVGLNETVCSMMPGGKIQWTLAQFMDYALVLSGSSFTVGVADEGLSTPTKAATSVSSATVHEPASTVHEPAPTPAMVHKPAPTPATFHKPTPTTFHKPTPATFHEPVSTPATFHEPAPTPAIVNEPTAMPAMVSESMPTPAMVKSQFLNPRPSQSHRCKPRPSQSPATALPSKPSTAEFTTMEVVPQSLPVLTTTEVVPLSLPVFTATEAIPLLLPVSTTTEAVPPSMPVPMTTEVVPSSLSVLTTMETVPPSMPVPMTTEVVPSSLSVRTTMETVTLPLPVLTAHQTPLPSWSRHPNRQTLLPSWSHFSGHWLRTCLLLHALSRQAMLHALSHQAMPQGPHQLPIELLFVLLLFGRRKPPLEGGIYHVLIMFCVHIF